MKKNEIVIICSFVLVSLVVGIILGYFWLPKDKKNEKFMEVDIHNQVVQDLYEKANPSADYIDYASIYQGDKFSNEFIIGSAFVNYLKENAGSMDNPVSARDIELYVKKTFGDISFSHQGGFIVSEQLCRFIYNEETSSYDYLVGCGGSENYRMLKKIISARKSDDEYIITEKSIILYNTSNYDNKPFTLYVYSDVLKNKELAKFENILSSPEVKIEDYLEEAAIYEYHFVFDGENFVYKSLDKVR